MPDKLRQGIEELLAAEQHLVMNRVQMRRNLSGIGKFAVALLGVADRKCLHRRPANFGHQRGHCTGIDAATEKYAQRNVAHQVAAHRLLEHLAILRNIIGLRTFEAWLRQGKVPVLLNL